MKFNINKIDPVVLGQFKLINTEDGLWLFRFKSDEPANVMISTVKRDWRETQSFSVNVGREDRTIETIISILRTSANYYTVNGTIKGQTKSQRCGSIEDVSNYIKENFCINLFNNRR